MTYNDTMIRSDQYIAGLSGKLFMREIINQGIDESAQSVLLIHGARVPGVPSFDLPVPGGSLAADLARAGLRVFIGDLAGYGYSDRPPAMTEPPDQSVPLIRAREAARDIHEMIAWIVRHSNQENVSLLGWATGGMWCGYLAANFPEQIDKLILYNSLYRSPAHPSLGHGSSLEDPQRPGRFNDQAIGGYRFNSAESLLGAWDASIPVDDHTDWRDPDVAESYLEEALRSDSSSNEREPPSFRAPSGALEDSYYQACGRQLFDASLIECPVLIVAGERDFWSQPVDRSELVSHLSRSPHVKVEVISNATHFVHLDRETSGRGEFCRAVVNFLAGEENAACQTE